MHSVHLAGIDLNLLVVLDVLLQEQSVTRAAGRLHRTQSAVSHALNRLRDVFDDELLVRDGRRMRPTRRAEGLAESLPRVLEQIRRAMAPPDPFDATASDRTFRLAAPDFLTAVLPTLLKAFGQVAPHASVELMRVGPNAVRDLAEGGFDALIAPPQLADESLRGVPLGAWAWAVFGRRGHPAFDRWSLDAWAAHPHLRVRTASPRGSGPVDVAAHDLGRARTIGAIVPQFSSVPSILAATDLLFTAPTLALGPGVDAYELDHRPVPFDLPPMLLTLFRSALAGDDPGIRWFLGRVFEAVSTPSDGASSV